MVLWFVILLMNLYNIHIINIYLCIIYTNEKFLIHHSQMEFITLPQYKDTTQVRSACLFSTQTITVYVQYT